MGIISIQTDYSMELLIHTIWLSIERSYYKKKMLIKSYLKVFLLIIIVGHANSAKATERLSSSKSLLQIKQKYNKMTTLIRILRTY